MEHTIEKIRRRNLELLVKEFGTQSAVALACETSSSNLSHILISYKKKSGKIITMGSALARKIEAGCNKPTGWMDISHDEQPENELVQLYDRMTDDMRELLLSHARLIVKMRNEKS